MSDTSTLSAAGGKIMLVGLGPGSHEHLTARARAAIAEADTLLLTVPNTLGVDYNAHLFENLAAVARELGWKE